MSRSQFEPIAYLGRLLDINPPQRYGPVWIGMALDEFSALPGARVFRSEEDEILTDETEDWRSGVVAGIDNFDIKSLDGTLIGFGIAWSVARDNPPAEFLDLQANLGRLLGAPSTVSVAYSVEYYEWERAGISFVYIDGEPQSIEFTDLDL